MATPAPTPMETEEEGGSGRAVAGAGVVGDLLNDPVCFLDFYFVLF